MSTDHALFAETDLAGAGSFLEHSPLGKLYRKRVAQNRDLTVLIGDMNLERGSGKTTLALRMAEAFDRSDEGMTLGKATLSAQELTQAYTREEHGSALLFDEGQNEASNRRAMSSLNEALRMVIGMGRVEGKYLIATTPGIHQIDRDIRNMADVWIFVTELGQARMFRVRYNPFSNSEYTDDWGPLTWPGDLPGNLSSIYEEITAEKRRRLRGEGEEGNGYVPAEDVEEAAEEARKETKRQTRDDLLRQMYEKNDDLTQKQLAESVGLSRSRVADILSDD